MFRVKMTLQYDPEFGESLIKLGTKICSIVDDNIKEEQVTMIREGEVNFDVTYNTPAGVVANCFEAIADLIAPWVKFMMALPAVERAFEILQSSSERVDNLAEPTELTTDEKNQETIESLVGAIFGPDKTRRAA